MSSREQILKAVQQNKPEEVLLETFPSFPKSNRDLTALFQASLESIGGASTVIESVESLDSLLEKEPAGQPHFVNGIQHSSGYNLAEINSFEARTLESVQTAVLKGAVGVAENGAVWVTERNMGHRIVPFITQRLILVLEEALIVETMHDAYEQLQIDKEGYGVFIAGPSKTADIEQSLVIGAHGPITMQVFILKK